MSKIKEYKCPNCGGSVTFDSHTQQMVCPYCDSQLDINIFKEQVPHKEKQLEEQQVERCLCGKPVENSLCGQCGRLNLGFHWHDYDDQLPQWNENLQDMDVYACTSCGAQIIAEKVVGAGVCLFCGSTVVFKDKFSGGLRPDGIIPFKLSKEDAQKAYVEHIKGLCGAY